jgi:hypothetical protein
MDIQRLVREARAANVTINFDDGRLRCLLIGERMPNSQALAAQLHSREPELRALYASKAALVWSEVLQAEILVLNDCKSKMSGAVRRTTKKGVTTWKPVGQKALTKA